MQNEIEAKTVAEQGTSSHQEQRIVHPCHDCGMPSTGILLMNTTIGGSFEYLCADCREQNDPDGVMEEPCPSCHGSGKEWEGWDCYDCDGTGTLLG